MTLDAREHGGTLEGVAEPNLTVASAERESAQRTSLADAVTDADADADADTVSDTAPVTAAAPAPVPASATG